MRRVAPDADRRPALPTHTAGPHEDGTVAEVARAAWPEIDLPVLQVHITTTLPGRTGPGACTQASTDRLFVVCGLVSIVVYDGREDSPTFRSVNEFRVSERNPGLLVIPPEPVPRLEEHRGRRGLHHQHAVVAVRARGPRRPGPALRVARGRGDRALALVVRSHLGHRAGRHEGSGHGSGDDTASRAWTTAGAILVIGLLTRSIAARRLGRLHVRDAAPTPAQAAPAGPERFTLVSWVIPGGGVACTSGRQQTSFSARDLIALQMTVGSPTDVDLHATSWSVTFT